MKALIVEDEVMARRQLARTITEEFPDMEIIGQTGSVAETVAWLADNSPDIIFMDVELSDGKCFEIFRLAKVTAKVIITTAYDSYAVKAFEAGSVDYLLKPIEREALQRAVSRCRARQEAIDTDKLLEALGAKPSPWRERFLVQVGGTIVPVRTSEIAYFFAEAKNNYVVTLDGTAYILDASLDAISTQLDPEVFFRASRSLIIAKEQVRSMVKLLGGRLQIRLNGQLEHPGQFSPDLTVSRSRTEDFLAWLEK